MIYSKSIPDFKKTASIPEKDVGILLERENLIVKDVEEHSFIKSSDRKSYFKHPTFTYRGNHENFVVGLFGEATLQVNGKDRKSWYDKSFKKASENNYQAFAMKFKLPGEHRFDDTTYNAEIHVHMIKSAGSNEKMAKMFNLDDSLAYRQFANGFNKDDALEMDKLLNDMTDAIIVIPLSVDINMSGPNMFMHYLNHEDWFEAAALGPNEVSQLDSDDKLKVNNKDLEMPTIQDSKDQSEE